MRDLILARLAATDEHDDEETKRRTRQLTERRRRLRDLFEIGDLERQTYVAKRDAIDAELDSPSPGPPPTSTAPAPSWRTSRCSGRP